MFLEALAMMGEIHILFYVGPGVEISPERARQTEKALQEHWNCQASVALCRDSTTIVAPGKGPLAERIREWGILHPFFYRASGPEQLAAIDSCLRLRPSAVFVHKIYAMLPLLLTRQPTGPVFLDLDDVEHIAFLRNLRQPPFRRFRLIHYLKLPSLIWLERKGIARATTSFVCSDKDGNHLVRLLRLPKVSIVSNAVELPPCQDGPNAQVFLFLGTFRYAPNTMAADLLIRRIWPLIRSELSDARLIIAGEGPENIPSFGEVHQGVEFRGFVDDLGCLYREARVVLCPIQSGSGTRVKIIEAAAHGKAIVSTSLGAEGLSFVDKEEIVLEDDCISIARACISLGNDSERCKKLGMAARMKAHALYGKEQAIKKIIDVIAGSSCPAPRS